MGAPSQCLLNKFSYTKHIKLKDWLTFLDPSCAQATH